MKMSRIAAVPGFFCLQDLAQYFEARHSQGGIFDGVHEADRVEGAQAMAAADRHLRTPDERLSPCEPSFSE